MPSLRQLLFQWRQRSPNLRQRSTLGEDVRARHRAEFESALYHIQMLLQSDQDVLRGLNLSAQRRFPYRRGDDIGGERKMSGLQLKGVEVDLSAQRSQLAPRAAENIQQVRDIDRGVVEVEHAAAAWYAERRGRRTLPGG